MQQFVPALHALAAPYLVLAALSSQMARTCRALDQRMMKTGQSSHIVSTRRATMSLYRSVDGGLALEHYSCSFWSSASGPHNVSLSITWGVNSTWRSVETAIPPGGPGKSAAYDPALAGDQAESAEAPLVDEGLIQVWPYDSSMSVLLPMGSLCRAYKLYKKLGSNTG